MESPYSNGFRGSGSRSGSRNPFESSSRSICEDFILGFGSVVQSLWLFLLGTGRKMVTTWALQALESLRRNLHPRRLLSFPHLLVGIWLLVLLRGERWVFQSKVERCRWKNWEDRGKWPLDAQPHHLVFIADPQIIDPHSYPGRPWPLSPLTVLITDNYLRRGYAQLQRQLQPDSLFFLGDLFDGGREWKTAHGDFEDASWAHPHPNNEQKYIKKWKKKYGEDYWLREYNRFSDIFFKPYDTGRSTTERDKRARKLVASLPGNHDLGFGSEVKVPVRDRFTTYFGEPNRVDVVGNHTIVSVDTVSLSADTSDQMGRVDLKHIYGPAEQFLKDVKATKRKAVARELRFWQGGPREPDFDHTVVDTNRVRGSSKPDTTNSSESVADFPTILLTHVPLYRDPGTPCGPMREHWPPSKHVKDQTGKVEDHRNAISVSSGYQYQNVLSEEDSVKLITSIGNVIHVFSGDDHDYCEVVHSDSKQNVKEITVKSMSMAMGVPTPGFLMVSLFNPVDKDGASLHPDRATIQTHLCLLPNQINTYFGYIYLGLFTLVALLARAFLVPILRLTPFALDPKETNPSTLPLYKDKADDRDPPGGAGHSPSPASGTTASYTPRSLPPRLSSLSASSRTRVSSVSSNGSARASGKYKSKPGLSGKWGWAGARRGSGPRIEISKDDLYDGGKSRSGTWRAASSRRRVSISLVTREFSASAWRVVWMAVAIWGWLAYKG